MLAKYQKGSFTIEASIITPMVLFLMVSVLQMGISFYQDSCLQKRHVKWEKFDAVSLFYQVQLVDELGKEYLSNEL